MDEFHPLGLHRTRVIPFLAVTFWRHGVFGKLPPSSLTAAKVPKPTSRGVVSRPLPDQANAAGLARCLSPGDSWCSDREFQRSNGLDESPSLTARFTDLKTEGQRGRVCPRPRAVPLLPGTLKASCLTSWSIQNALSTSAHETSNSSFGDKKTNQQTNSSRHLYKDPGPSSGSRAWGSGLTVFAVL